MDFRDPGERIGEPASLAGLSQVLDHEPGLEPGRAAVELAVADDRDHGVYRGAYRRPALRLNGQPDGNLVDDVRSPRLHQGRLRDFGTSVRFARRQLPSPRSIKQWATAVQLFDYHRLRWVGIGDVLRHLERDPRKRDHRHRHHAAKRECLGSMGRLHHISTHPTPRAKLEGRHRQAVPRRRSTGRPAKRNPRAAAIPVRCGS